ncbi:uncharacterized protein LOC135341114 [Halichondria panicea]|uniref:uncharacterized protein LOC135341114 n=1 Tax=Halichondria panicea TaxID=6063 RepID=UPI00312BAAB3
MQHKLRKVIQILKMIKLSTVLIVVAVCSGLPRRGSCYETKKLPSDNTLMIQKGEWIEANIVVTGLSESDKNSIFISLQDTCIHSPNSNSLAKYLWTRSSDICPPWAGTEEDERCKWLTIHIKGDADSLNNTKIGWCHSTEGGTDIKPQYLIIVTTSKNWTSTSGQMKTERGLTNTTVTALGVWVGLLLIIVMILLAVFVTVLAVCFKKVNKKGERI